MTDLFYDAPLVAMGATLFASLFAACEIGRRLGARLGAGGGERTEQGFILSGVMGLLALLIAFTFSLALDRHETRRELVVAEANAIGTAEMRAHLLDPLAADRLSGLLRAYAETRLRYGRAPSSDRPQLERESVALRARIQAETLDAVESLRSSPLITLIVPPINETLDLGAAREAAMNAHLPTEVLIVLTIYALVAAGVLGAALASGRPHRLMTALMFLLLTLAIATILDLDRPRRGAIQVSQAPMRQLVEGFAPRPPPAAPASPPSPAMPGRVGAGAPSAP